MDFDFFSIPLCNSNSETLAEIDHNLYFYQIPCLPIRVDNDETSVYTAEQIDNFGFPETWGVFNYYVTTTLEHERPLVMDWKYEQYIRGTSRPIHRYDRVKRFESTMFQLLGLRGHVDPEVVLELEKHGNIILIKVMKKILVKSGNLSGHF